MRLNEDAAPAAATARGGGESKKEACASRFAFDPLAQSTISCPEFQRFFFHLLRLRMQNDFEFVPYSLLSCISLIPEQQLTELVDDLDGAIVFVFREAGDEQDR